MPHLVLPVVASAPPYNSKRHSCCKHGCTNYGQDYASNGATRQAVVLMYMLLLKLCQLLLALFPRDIAVAGSSQLPNWHLHSAIGIVCARVQESR